MTEQARSDFGALAAYLRTNRAFVAPAIEHAVRSLNLPDGARVLAAGTGAGGGLVALARAVAGARVVGVDLNPAVIDLAAEHAEQMGLDGRVTLRTADLRAVLDESAGEFDAIWAYNKSHHPTARGHTLLSDLAQDRIHHLMMAGLRADQIHPKPDGKTLIEAQRRAVAPRKPPQRGQFDDITVDRLRITHPFHTLLRHLIDHHRHDEFYGLELLQPTGIDEGTLYPNLKSMEHAGWLTSHTEDEQAWLAGAPPGRGPGRRRTYYSLTPEGRRAALHELHHHTFRNQKKARTK